MIVDRRLGCSPPLVRISAFAFKAAKEFVGRRTIIMEKKDPACNHAVLLYVLLGARYWADNAQPWLFLLSCVGCPESCGREESGLTRLSS